MPTCVVPVPGCRASVGRRAAAPPLGHLRFPRVPCLLFPLLAPPLPFPLGTESREGDQPRSHASGTPSRERTRPNSPPCVCSLLQLVISGPVQQSPHATLPPGFYPHIHTPPLGYGAVPAHPALPTHPGHTFLSGMTFPFRPIR